MRIRTKQQKMKIIYLSVLGLVMMSLGVLGAWSIYLEATITGNIVSNEGETMYWTSTFDDFNTLNTTTSDGTLSSQGSFLNEDGNLNMTFSATELITDVNDTCSNEGDLTFTYYIDNEIINDGENKIIGSGEHNVTLEVYAVLASCPSGVEVSLSLG